MRAIIPVRSIYQVRRRWETSHTCIRTAMRCTPQQDREEYRSLDGNEAFVPRLSAFTYPPLSFSITLYPRAVHSSSEITSRGARWEGQASS